MTIFLKYGKTRKRELQEKGQKGINAIRHATGKREPGITRLGR